MRSPALLFILAAVLLCACAGTVPPAPTTTPLPPTAAPTLTSTPTPIPTPTPTPTPTPELFEISATVWQSDPAAPVLNYHNFLPDRYPESTGMKLRWSDFRAQLQALYDAGYSSVALEDWLDGDLRVPVGRRPVILTLDDAFLAQQLFIDPDGTPSPKTGLGVYWRFAQEHPDFGFHIAIFANMGDKWYGNVDTGTWWFATTGWQDALGKVIAWGMQNGAPVYNHLFTHPDLEQTSGNDIPYQMRANDDTIRKFLTQVGRADLIPSLGNIIALPYGLWPINKDSVKILLAYKNPENKPLRAVMEAGYEYTPTLMLAPYNEKFDPYHIPRMAGLPRVIRYLDENRASVATAAECRLSLEKARADQPDTIAAQILRAVQSGTCPAGVYALPGKLLFRADAGTVQSLQIRIP